MRPQQWGKNLLVFAALIFSKSYLEIDNIMATLITFIAFCLVSSSVYLMNDYFDRKRDSLNPLKKNRPIASGKLNGKTVITAILILLLLSISLSFTVNANIGIIILIYFAVNIAYSLELKKIAILEAFVIAFGFLLRSYSGGEAIDVNISSWLMLCTIFLALIMTFGKRRHELVSLGEKAGDNRICLQGYTIETLNMFILIMSAAGLITYSLYTIDKETVSRYGTTHLIYSTIFVAYGILRFIYLVINEDKGGKPSKMIFSDKSLLLNGVLWIIFVIIVISI